MIDVDRLEQIAQQLVARLRDDDPKANQRWLHALTTPGEREALLYVLAAAVPDDRTWRQLTAWTEYPGETDEEYRRRYQREWQRNRRARSRHGLHVA